MTFSYETPRGTVTVTLKKHGDNWLAVVGDTQYELSLDRAPDGALLMHLSDNRVITAHVVEKNGFHVWAGGKTSHFGETGTAARAGHVDAGSLDAPMPGTILKVHVAAGDEVTENQVLLVVEAMKMEHAIKAPRDGRVARVCFDEGASVAQGDILVEME